MLHIVILNWNGFDDTCDCIGSLQRSSFSNFQIIVVDNGSANDEAIKLETLYGNIDVLKNKHNLGFAEGCNVGIRHALQDPACHAIFLLNNDTRVPAETLGALVEKLNPTTLVSPAILYDQEPLRVQNLGGKLYSFLGGTTNIAKNVPYATLHRQPCSPDFLSGCALMASRQVFEKLEGFDSDYFAYFEDVDFCYRARAAGYQLCVYPDIRLMHKHSRSLGKVSPVKRYLILRNTLLFARKRFRGLHKLCFIFNAILLQMILQRRTFLSTRGIHVFWAAVRDGFSGRRRFP